jgi:tRNA-dihydrouridine synthase
LQTGSYDEIDSSKRIQTGFYELNLLASDIGETMACKEMRKRFCAYSKGLPSGASLREKVIHAETISDYKTIFNEYI